MAAGHQYVGLNSIWGMDFLYFCSVMGQSATQGNLPDCLKRFCSQTFMSLNKPGSVICNF